MRAFHHKTSCVVQKCDQMLNCVTSGVLDVLQGFFSIKIKPLSNLLNSLRPECTFSVNVNYFSISSSFLFGKLSGDTQCVCKLSLASSELSKSFSNGHGLDSAAKKLIEDSGACGNFDDTFSFLGQLISSHESVIFEFFDGFENFLDFGFVDTFDIAEVLFGGHDKTGDGAVASTFEFGDIGSIDTVILKFFNFNERSRLDFFSDVLGFFLDNFLFFLGLFSLLHVK